MKTKVMNNANKPAAEPRRGREAAGHVRHSHAAGPRHLGRGAGWWRGGGAAISRPPRSPLPARERPPPPRRGLGGARQFPPGEPSRFPSSRASRALCLPGWARMRGGRRHLTLSAGCPPLGPALPSPLRPRAAPSSPPGSARGRGRAGREGRGGREEGERKAERSGRRTRLCGGRAGAACYKGGGGGGGRKSVWSGASSRDSQTRREERAAACLPAWLPRPPSLLFMDSLAGLPLFFPPPSVSRLPKMIQLHGCH